MSERPQPFNGPDLLQFDEPFVQSHYKEYRMSLEAALNRAERNERLSFHACWIGFLLAFVLMFVGGTQILGSFDPTDDRATAVSIALASIYALAMLTWPLAAAFYFSRVRPRIKRIKEDIRDAEIAELKRDVAELRDVIQRKG
jgi:hypothetical protein